MHVLVFILSYSSASHSLFLPAALPDIFAWCESPQNRNPFARALLIFLLSLHIKHKKKNIHKTKKTAGYYVSHKHKRVSTILFLFSRPYFHLPALNLSALEPVSTSRNSMTNKKHEKASSERVSLGAEKTKADTSTPCGASLVVLLVRTRPPWGWSKPCGR